MVNEQEAADQTRTMWSEPPAATVAMALGKQRMPYRVAELVALRGWTYFISAACGSIKIGRTFGMAYRLAELQCANPKELELLAVVPDGGREAEYHHQFAEHRLRGEWFEPHPDILAEIERIRTRI